MSDVFDYLYYGCYDRPRTEYSDNNSHYSVDPQQVDGAEALAQFADNPRQQVPPRTSARKESRNHKNTAGYASKVFGGRVILQVEGRKQKYQPEYKCGVGEREQECRDVVLPKVCLATLVSTNLHRRVGHKDTDANKCDTTPSDEGYDCHILLDERVYKGDEEEGDDGEQGVGCCRTKSRNKTRKTTLAQCALDAHHADRAERNRGDETYDKSSYEKLNCHYAVSSSRK